MLYEYLKEGAKYMELNEIIEQLKYYTEDLPKEALKNAIKNKEKMIPELLKMLEYTKENLEKIFNEEDEFFGYIYAYFLLHFLKLLLVNLLYNILIVQ